MLFKRIYQHTMVCRWNVWQALVSAIYSFDDRCCCWTWKNIAKWKYFLFDCKLQSPLFATYL